MALDEPTDEMEKLESNGIGALIDPNLSQYLKNYGVITIDYVSSDFGPSGFSIRVGNSSCDPMAGNCSSCG